jgi:hypothetical protein
MPRFTRFVSRPQAAAACALLVAGVLVGVPLPAQDKKDPPPPPPFPSTPLIPSGAVVLHDAAPGDNAVPMNFPDKFAWKLFLEVNQRAPQQGPVNDKPNAPTSNDAVWETWASDPQTFPRNPDPAKKPEWPAANASRPRTFQATQKTRSFRARGGKAMAAAQGVDVPQLPPGGFSVPNGAGVGEEVHRNKVTFDYIVSNGLWYQEGIAAFYKTVAAAAGDDVQFAAKAINFPRGSIEVKGNWIAIEEKDKSRYHWNYSSSGQLVGLVAMHISSKDLPNWFWSTFEHVDNPGRGDFIGVHDSFGADPPHTPSKTDKAGGIYPAEARTKALEEMFAAKGFKGAWGDEFKNYRLKGTQIDFTDSAGRPLLLGNSVTESGFVPTASCITCHARATVNAAGANGFPTVGKNFGFGEQAQLPLLSGDSLQPVVTYNGRPDPSWYFHESSNGTSLRLLQTDFVWAIPFQARPAAKK